MLSIRSCGAYKQVHTLSGGVSEGCLDIYQTIKREREMQGEEHMLITEAEGRWICQCVKVWEGNWQEMKLHWTSVAIELMVLLAVESFKLYSVFSAKKSREIGWQILHLAFSRIVKALEGLERWASENDSQSKTVQEVWCSRRLRWTFGVQEYTVWLYFWIQKFGATVTATCLQTPWCHWVHAGTPHFLTCFSTAIRQVIGN